MCVYTQAYQKRAEVAAAKLGRVSHNFTSSFSKFIHWVPFWNPWEAVWEEIFRVSYSLFSADSKRLAVFLLSRIFRTIFGLDSIQNIPGFQNNFFFCLSLD
jgi:hypothetical protein